MSMGLGAFFGGRARSGGAWLCREVQISRATGRCLSSLRSSDDGSTGIKLLKKGAVTPVAQSAVPAEIPRPPYAAGQPIPPMTSLPPYIAPSWTSSHKAIGGSDSEDDDARKLRRACQIAAEALDFAGSLVKPGIRRRR